MKKRLFSLILALALLCTLLPQAALTASAETYSGICGAEGDNLTWSLDTETGLLTITGSGKMADYEYPGNRAPWYDYRQSITAVSLPEGLTSIGDWAFAFCSALTAVTIPDSVTNIGNYAFYGCSSLTGVTIPDSVTSIGGYAFRGCSTLTAVTIPDSVTSIGNYAFYGCSALTSVTLPASVIIISSYAFGYKSNELDVSDHVRMDSFTIYGYNGIAAQTYAEENGLTFISLDNAVGEFVDVTPGDYFANPVLWAINHDPAITAGVGVHSFGPNNSCTREQIVTFLWAAQGKPEPTSTVSPFSDVAIGDWFCKAILWAAENGVTAGIGEGLFGVYNTCTRAQIITFLYKAYK